MNKEVTSIAKRLGATEKHAGVFLDKLRNPKAVGNAPLEVVKTWVRALADAVDSGEMDYGSRFAYGAFNLLSALPFAARSSSPRSLPADVEDMSRSFRIRLVKASVWWPAVTDLDPPRTLPSWSRRGGPERSCRPQRQPPRDPVLAMDVEVWHQR